MKRIRVKELASEDYCERIDRFIRRHRSSSYQEYLRQGGFVDHLCARVVGLVKKQTDGRVFLAWEHGRIAGLASIVDLPWDSRHFRTMMAKVETLICEDRDNRDVRAGLVRAVLAHCRRAGVRHLSVRLDAEDLATVDVLERNGFRLVDAMCIFLYDLKEQPVLDPSSTGDFRVRPIRKAEVSAIRAMAQEAFRQGRFHRDGNLPQDRSDALYAGLARALRKDGTAEILAAEVAGKCVGFIAGVPDHALNPFLAKRLAYLWLVTVLPEYCGRGIATGLTKALLAALAGKVDLVEIGTQVYNYPALRLYQRLGCRPVSSVLTFHRWEESVATSW